jgi:hypothetical protein
VTIEGDRRNTVGEVEIFAICLISKSSLSGLLQQKAKGKVFENGSSHILGSDINCGLKKID